MRVCRAIAEIREESRKEGFDRGILQGRSQGISEGISQGITQNLRQNIDSLKETLGCSTEQALDYLKVPAEERSKYLNP